MVEVGQRFERLVVVAVDPPKRRRKASCRCDCGKEKRVDVYKLEGGTTRSCGCLRREMRTESNVTHGATRTPTHRTWAAMQARCLIPSHSSYERYGGRGIKICERWLGRDGFQNFVADMGERPEGMTIERIDNDRGYEPDNCRWATRKEQGQNTAATKLEAHEPDQIRWLVSLGYSQTEVGRFFGIGQSTVSEIVRHTAW